MTASQEQARVVEASSQPVPTIRRTAESRQHALGHSDAAVMNVSAGVFWMIWRDGCNFALTESSKMAALFRDVGEWIVLLGQAREAAPTTCPHCGGVLES